MQKHKTTKTLMDKNALNYEVCPRCLGTGLICMLLWAKDFSRMLLCRLCKCTMPRMQRYWEEII